MSYENSSEEFEFWGLLGEDNSDSDNDLYEDDLEEPQVVFDPSDELLNYV